MAALSYNNNMHTNGWATSDGNYQLSMLESMGGEGGEGTNSGAAVRRRKRARAASSNVPLKIKCPASVECFGCRNFPVLVVIRFQVQSKYRSPNNLSDQ